jgi:hypothetical protein
MEAEHLLNLFKAFEGEHFASCTLEMYSDGSGRLQDGMFETLCDFDNLSDLAEYLEHNSLES